MEDMIMSNENQDKTQDLVVKFEVEGQEIKLSKNELSNSELKDYSNILNIDYTMLNGNYFEKRPICDC